MYFATYLDTNVFSSHDFCSHRLFKVVKACCIDQRTRLSISWCLKSFLARCRMQFDAERQGNSLDRFAHAVFDKWSFLRPQFLQIPLLTACWITELRSLASKSKVSSNRSQQRISTVFNESWHLSNVAVSRQIKDFWTGTSCTGPGLVFPWQAADTHWAVSPKRILISISKSWLHEIAQTYHPADSWVCFFTNAFYLDT